MSLPISSVTGRANSSIARAHNGGRFRDHGRALGESCAPPGLKAGRRGFNRRFELVVGEFLERLQCLAVIGVDALVSHGFLLCPALSTIPTPS